MRNAGLLFLLPLLVGFGYLAVRAAPQGETGVPGKKYKVVKTEAEWKKQLPAESYKVLRKRGTERAFSGKYDKNKAAGIYSCLGCGQELFSSTAKFDSGTGWPSFYQPLTKSAVDTRSDFELGVERIEVLCSRCGGHLGHVFGDGPKPTGLRYCMNSVSLSFKPKS